MSSGDKIRKIWSQEAMFKAVEAVRKKETRYFKASEVYGVPKGTIEKYVKKGDDS